MAKNDPLAFSWGREIFFVDSYDRDWLPKFATGQNMIIGCSSKSIWLTRLLFCQNGSPMRGSFWQKKSFITHILFEIQPIIIFSPVANFDNQSIWNFVAIPSICFRGPWTIRELQMQNRVESGICANCASKINAPIYKLVFAIVYNLNLFPKDCAFNTFMDFYLI